MLASIPEAGLRSRAAEIDQRCGAAAYLKDQAQEQELIAWIRRDAGARR
jgi:hypothetical protein